jgi:hypothetical protein
MPRHADRRYVRERDAHSVVIDHFHLVVRRSAPARVPARQSPRAIDSSTSHRSDRLKEQREQQQARAREAQPDNSHTGAECDNFPLSTRVESDRVQGEALSGYEMAGCWGRFPQLAAHRRMTTCRATLRKPFNISPSRGRVPDNCGRRRPKNVCRYRTVLLKQC